MATQDHTEPRLLTIGPHPSRELGVQRSGASGCPEPRIQRRQSPIQRAAAATLEWLDEQQGCGVESTAIDADVADNPPAAEPAPADEPTQPPVVKRGRGRPRKISTPETSMTTTSRLFGVEVMRSAAAESLYQLRRQFGAFPETVVNVYQGGSFTDIH